MFSDLEANGQIERSLAAEVMTTRQILDEKGLWGNAEGVTVDVFSVNAKNSLDSGGSERSQPHARPAADIDYAGGAQQIHGKRDDHGRRPGGIVGQSFEELRSIESIHRRLSFCSPHGAKTAIEHLGAGRHPGI